MKMDKRCEKEESYSNLSVKSFVLNDETGIEDSGKVTTKVSQPHLLYRSTNSEYVDFPFGQKRIEPYWQRMYHDWEEIQKNPQGICYLTRWYKVRNKIN